jgi:HlyD family secretion protein
MTEEIGRPAVLRLAPAPAADAKGAAAGRRTARWRLALVLLALLLAAGLGAAWWMRRGAPSVHYLTVSASRGLIERAVTATGTVNPELTIIVGSYVSGVIQTLYCDYNTEVKAGQICAKIDPRPYQAALDQYSAQLLRDQAILAKDRTDLARYQKLSAQNSIARQQAEDQVYLVQQDEGTVKLDEALVENAKLNLGYTDIVSPVDGTVVSRNVTQGQTVAASFQTPTLFLIASDLKKMQVDTNVSESDVGGIKEGSAASFTVDAFPKRIFQGKVTQLRQSPQTVQNVVTFDAVIGVDNRDLALMPGMTASTRIIIDRRSDVLRVPNLALRYAPAGAASAAGAGTSTGTAPGASPQPRLWVLRDGQPVGVPVVTGLDDDTFTEIVQGDLRAGDLVITGEERGPSGGQAAAPPPRL